MRRLGAVLAGVAAAACLVAPAPADAATGTGPCAAIAAAEPQSGHNMPPPAPGYFPASAQPAYPHFAPDFPVIKDCEWGYPIGGFGGIRKRAPIKHTPIVFVHGNQADAENWFLVRDQLLKLGYTDQEMYAISYNGLANWYAGAPDRSQPDASTQAYLAANSKALYNGGNGAADDVNVPDVYAFVQAVMAYTGSQRVDLVAHSLGVTIVRKMMYDHRELYSHVLAGVMIAGANHGTSVCYGLQASYYGCDEIAPDDSATGYVNPWLKQLNSIGEAPGPTCWQSIYDGSAGDPFFNPPFHQDNPHMQGADNRTFPGLYHNDLRVDPATVSVYAQFLQSHGQAATFRPCGLQPEKAASQAAVVAAPESDSNQTAVLAANTHAMTAVSATEPATVVVRPVAAQPAAEPGAPRAHPVAATGPAGPAGWILAAALLLVLAAGAASYLLVRRRRES